MSAELGIYRERIGWHETRWTLDRAARVFCAILTAALLAACLLGLL